ncbi:MAG TPA: hypothetical protein VNN77_08660 [candidate division Zixibacteria bacterium]|nr:hypothetical protein [candidate division Zixibacteria bacterium]
MLFFVTFLALLFWGKSFGLAEAAFIIRLKNGNEFVTGRYWVEGTQVLFDAYGGVFGVEKQLVAKIEPSEKAVRLLVAPAGPAEKTTQVDRPEKPAAIERAEGPPTKTRKPDDLIQREFAELKEQSRKIDGMLTSELLELSNRLAVFRRKLQQEGKTNEYLKEFTELQEIGETVEAALKSRRQ